MVRSWQRIELTSSVLMRKQVTDVCIIEDEVFRKSEKLVDLVIMKTYALIGPDHENALIHRLQRRLQIEFAFSRQKRR